MCIKYWNYVGGTAEGVVGEFIEEKCEVEAESQRWYMYIRGI